MRRHRLFRIFAIPLAAWFVAFAMDVGGVDACPMHDGMAHAMSAAMPGMAPNSMPGMRPAPADPTAPAPHAPVHCTCMGACCGCTIATLPPAPEAPVAAIAAVRGAARIDHVERPLAAPAPFLLPPSIGPPALHG